MLAAFQLPNMQTITSSGAAFSAVINTTTYLWDKRAGVKTLWTQNTAGIQTLTLTVPLNTTDGSLDFNTLLYPYLLMGVVNIGNSPYIGQLFPNVAFTPNGKWGASGANIRTMTAALGPTGYSSAWGMIHRSAIVGGVATDSMTVTLTGNFQTGFGNFGIGEVIIAGAFDLPLGDVNIEPVDPSAVNRSGGNVPWSVLRRPYRRVTGRVVPQSRADSFGVPALYVQNLQRMFFNTSRTAGIVVAPFWHAQGNIAPDLTLMGEHCHLARIISPSSLSGSASDNRFGGQVMTEELL
jgi:hypothetical protein